MLLRAYNYATCSHDLKSLGPVDKVAKLYYAQCWSLHSESDVVWKQRQQNGEDAVSVKTKVSNLRRVIKDANIKSDYYMIEKVSYFSDDEIREAVEEEQEPPVHDNATREAVEEQEPPMKESIFSNARLGAASPFFAKREAFAYENEVRLIVIAHNLDPNFTSKILIGRTPMLKIQFPGLKMEELIEEIVFSPYMNEDTYKELAQAVKQINPLVKIRRSRVREPL